MALIQVLAFGDNQERAAWRLACEPPPTPDRSAPIFELRTCPAWRTDALLPREQTKVKPMELFPEGFVEDRDYLWNSREGMVALSLQGDLLASAWRHRASGLIIPATPTGDAYGYGARRELLENECTELPPLSPEESAAHLRLIVLELFERGVSVVLLVTCFRHAAGGAARSVSGTLNPESLKAQRFNQALMQVSHDTGAYVIDADRALGALGWRELGLPDDLQGKSRYCLAQEILRTLYRGGPMDNFIDDAASLELPMIPEPMALAR